MLSVGPGSQTIGSGILNKKLSTYIYELGVPAWGITANEEASILAR